MRRPFFRTFETCRRIPHDRKRYLTACLSLCSACLTLFLLIACTDAGNSVSSRETTQTKKRMELSYADQFSVVYAEDGTALLTIQNEGSFLVVPAGVTTPPEEDIPVLQAPLKHIYLADSAAMDLFSCIDALSAIRTTATDGKNWSLPDIRDKMRDGEILYGGKYSAPDYELLLEEGTKLAIENTMIHHNPEIKEKLESLGIPVIVTRASYESHPLGRLEWVKLYGLLTGKTKEAEAFFREQEALLKSVLEDQATQNEPEENRRSVAFFYLSSNGAVNVRQPGDYVPKMIALAGGTYVFTEGMIPEEKGSEMRSTISLQQETFYAGARDADILIYNATIDGSVETLADLLEKAGWLETFKAVQSGNVWCTEMNLFQQTSGVAGIIEDMHRIVTGDADAEAQLRYLHRLQ